MAGLTATTVFLGGHLRTIAPRVQHTLRPMSAPMSAEWSLTVDDPQMGPVRLSGRYTGLDDTWGWAPGQPRRAVLLVHGLGGCADSSYMVRAAHAAAAEGLATLRLNLRGSDRRGEDFYHAGLSADLHATLASPDLAPYDELYAVGFSIGGHLVLRAGAEPSDPRLVAVAAVCPPVYLAPCADAIDRPQRAIYRKYLLSGLRSIYDAVAARREVPLPLDEARRIRTLREWDERVVAPRHGFAGADDYYRRASVYPHLGDLERPALLVGAEDDPMIPAELIRPWLPAETDRLTVRWHPAAGHLGYFRRADLGLGIDPEIGFDRQIFRWLIERSRR